ncbi:BPSS1780 family membrane protein [Ottowia sp.]|uniref:BPSS1780 family membrane protein n=1 Tax=Ottowia sp. TaxID=1898956 RepID=UPI0039E4D359
MQWVREGIRVFFRMPLAFAGLFFMFLAATVVLSIIPVVGDALALMMIPAATVGLMAATRQALDRRFPMPATLLAAFRQSPRQTRAMLALGALYAAALLLIMILSASLDDGQLARLVEKHGGRLTPDLMADPALQQAAQASMRQMLVGSLLYVPVAVLMWHAPALVHWHGLPVGKSLFFSAVAVLRNTTAYLVYGLGWAAVASVGWGALLIVAAVLGNIGLALSGLLPLSVLIASMFYASLWFTFRDSFAADEPAPVESIDHG